MKIKVCGLREEGNIKQVVDLSVDFVGFIFYDKSSRNVKLSQGVVKTISGLIIQKVGVFVNENINGIARLKTLLGLDYIQLHGNESVDYCMELQVFSKIIKVFKVDDDFDFKVCEQYQFADYFLFETKGKLEGGNGTKFNWQKLNEYHLSNPFFLSGGIGGEDVSELLSLNHPQLKVVDLNSKFEVSQGLKNIEQLKEFKNELSGR